MTNQTLISKKRRGPAPTGVGSPQLVRMQPALVDKIQSWMINQPDSPSRPEAIRRLVELGLMVKAPERPRSVATDQASRAIDAMDKDLQRATQPVNQDDFRGANNRRQSERRQTAGARAAELASEVVEKHIDPAAAPEERAVRKRRLIKGPSAFRDSRKDR